MKLRGFSTNTDLAFREPRELGFTKDFRDRESGVKLNVEQLTLVRESYDSAIAHIYDTIGRFENIPAEAELGEYPNPTTLINLYLDLKDVTIGLDDIDVGIGLRKSDGHFFTDANLLTFEGVRKKGFLPDSFMIDVPYLIVPDDLLQQQAIAITNLLMVGYQIGHMTLEIINAATNFADFIGTGLLVAVLQLAAMFIFLAFVLFRFLQALLKLQELYFPNLRYFKAIYDVDLIRQGCLALGYTLDSDLLNVDLNKMATMGTPEAIDGASGFQLFQNQQTQYFNKGYPTAQDPQVATLGGMIKFIEETFNARTFIYDGVVKIERRSYFVSTATTILDPTLTDQEGHDDSYTFNNAEMWGRRYDHWAVDFVDMHSPDTYDGMKSEYITEPIVTVNPDLVRLIGLKENAAPFALAGRKNGFTRVEELIRTYINDFLYSAISVALGGSSSASINDRQGIMMISQQYFPEPKKLWLDTEQIDGRTVGKQPANYKDILSMDNLFLLFKQDLNVINNNYAIKTMRVPFTPTQFIDMLLNNFMIYEPTGDVVELVDIEFFPQKFSANVTILLKDASAFNTKTTKLA